MGDLLPKLMLVTDRRRTRGRSLVRQVAEAVRGGVGLVQVREKDLTDDALRDLVGRIRGAVTPETLIVVNGSYRVARTTTAGLHLPASQPPPPDRRGLELYGRSVHDEAEAAVAVAERASYVVLGPIYPTSSKPGHPGAGTALIRTIHPRVQPIPVFAIGGVTISRIPELVRAGCHGVAVCGAILSANDPREVAQAMILALEVATGDSTTAAGRSTGR